MWSGLRLPTGAEWEKAASWDAVASRKLVFPWAEDWDEARLNWNAGSTTPVGAYSPLGDSPVGCADMSGNILEWVADWYDAGYYERASKRNPRGPAKGEKRVARGGAWTSIRQRSWRCANRDTQIWPKPSDKSSSSHGHDTLCEAKT